MKNQLLLLLVSLLILSCSKDDETSEDSTATLKLKKVYRNGEIYDEYEYNNNKISKSTYYSGSIDEEGNNEVWRVNYYEYVNDVVIRNSYDSDNILIYTRKYYRTTDNTQIRRDDYDTSGALYSYAIYNGYNNSCSHTSIEYFSNDDTLTSRDNIEYTDSNCSYSVTTYTNNNLVDYQQTYIKDDKVSAYKSTVIEPFALNSSKIIGNTISRTFKDSNNQTNNSNSYTSDYEYNEDNYPISETRTYLDGDIVEFTYEYY